MRLQRNHFEVDLFGGVDFVLKVDVVFVVVVVLYI